MAAPSMSGFSSLGDIRTQDVVGSTGAQMAAVLDNGANANLASSLRNSAMDSWKNAAIEKRQIAAEGRASTRQIDKEGRALEAQLGKEERMGLMDQAERDRVDALYDDPASRESKKLALDTAKAEASIAKERAAASKYSAEGAAATSRAQTARDSANSPRKSGKANNTYKDKPVKLNDVQKAQLKDLNTELEALIPGDDDKRIKQIRGAKNAIYMAADPAAKEKYDSLRRRKEELLAAKQAGVGTISPANKAPVKTSKIIKGVPDADVARISNQYPGQVLSKQKIAEIAQAEKLKEELAREDTKNKTLNPNLFNGGLLESLRVPR